MTKRIVLCADDYGQALSISDGILALLDQQRLSAVSCLANFPHWQEVAAKLIPYANQADLGLHLNLTEGRPLSAAFRNAYGETFPSLSQILGRSFLGQLDHSVLEAEFEAQLAEFTAKMGFAPRFIDGHQHVHQFPIVRDAMLTVYERHLTGKAYIRLAMPKLKIKHLKRLVIFLSGANVLRKELVKRNIPHNTTFSGSYSFAKAADFRCLFQSFLQEVGDGGLIMCHPGLNKSDASDPIAIAREREFSYFASEQFLEDCQRNDVKITRFSI